EQQHPDVAAEHSKQPRDHQAVAAVVALAADDGDRAGRREPADQVGEPFPGALHQLEPGNPALADRPLIERALLRSAGKRLEPRRKAHCAIATAAASRWLWVSNTSTRTPSVRARCATAPWRRTSGGPSRPST